jgi:HlyD family secretion protein
MKKKRTWFMLGIVAVVIGGVYLSTRSSGQASASRLLANTTTAQVIQTTLANSVDSTGSIIAEATVDLSFGTSGTVEQVSVVPGDQVKSGDVLARLDSSDLQLKVTQAEQAYMLQQLTYSETVQADASEVAVAQASYASAVASYNAAKQDYDNLAVEESVQCSSLTAAKSNLDQAQTAYDRLANDHQAKNYLSGDWGPFQSVVNNLTNAQSAYDLALANCNITKLSLNDSSLRSAQAQVQSAKADLDSLISPRAEKQIQAAAALEQARLSLEQATRSLAEATIVAPFDGVVTAVNIAAGGTSGSDAAITIADTSKLHVDVLVDETEIAGVQVAQQAELTLDALSGMTLTGRVANIDPSGTVSNGVVNYNVRVNLDPTDTALKLDMTANASLIGEKHEDVLAVPTTAIHTANSGQTPLTGQTRQISNTVQSGQTVTNTQSGQTGPQRIQGSFVLVLENGQPRPVQVTVGMTAGDLTEVSGDLKEGDQVLVSTTTSSANNNTQDLFGGVPSDGGAGGPPPDGGGGPPPF